MTKSKIKEALQAIIDYPTEDVFEAVLRNPGRRTEMPFAKLRSDIAGLLKAGGDGGFLVEAIESATVGLDTKAALKLADHQACARRHALRGSAVTLLRQRAAAGERIDVRCLDVCDGTLNANIGVAVVVGVDDDDVGLGSFGFRRDEPATNKAQRDESNESYHIQKSPRCSLVLAGLSSTQSSDTGSFPAGR